MSRELSEESPVTAPSEPEQSSQGNQKPQEASDENQSLVKTNEEGKKESQAETSHPTVDKSLAESAQSSLQALLANLTLDSMKELHARVEAGLAGAKAVLENPHASQEEVNAQVRTMRELTEEVNKALTGELTSPAELGEGRSVTLSEPSPTPRRGRGRRGPLTPPTAPVSTESQEKKETVEEATDYTNGPGSYPLLENIHKLFQELKTSTGNPEQVQKLKEAYDKLNEALQTKEDGLVDQEVFNAALEEYKKAKHLKKGAEEDGKTRSRRSVSGLVYGFATGSTGKEIRSKNDSGRERDTRNLYNGQNLNEIPLKYIATVETGTIRDISLSGFPTVGKDGKTWATIRTRIDNGGKRAVLTITGQSPKDLYGIYNTILTVTEGNGHVSSKTQEVLYQLPKPEFDESPLHPGKTAQQDVEGKAGDKPIVKGKIPTPPDGLKNSNIPKGTQIRMYLVRGGRNETFGGIETSAEGYEIVAWGLVGGDGTSVIYPTQYKKQSIGDKPLRLIVAYVEPGTERISNRDLVSPLSRDSITPTNPIDRDGAKSDADQKANAKKQSFDGIAHLTTEERNKANKQVDAALEKAKQAIDAANNQRDIETAKTTLEQDLGQISPTAEANKSAKSDADQKANLTLALIDDNENLSLFEKDAAKNQVRQALQDALKRIDQAKTQAEIDQAKQAALSSMDQVLAEALARANARRLSGTRNRRTPPRRARRSVGFVGNSQTGTTPSAVDKSELRTLVEDLERRLKELEGLSPEALEEAQRILREAQAALANDSLTAQELAKLLAKVRQALNSIQAGTSADKSPSTSNSNKEAESAKEPTNATDVPLYGVFGAAALSLLGALLFALAHKKNSQLDKLSRELDQLLVELEASDKDKKGLGKAKKLAKKARTFVDSQQKDPQKEAELISEIKTILSQFKEGV
ncbi:surface anchored protein [Streptococcus pneumoniae]|nr:surface anchored protein [Streptococcus pneumoniae]